MRRLLSLALLVLLGLLAGCGGEQGHADRRIQSPSMTDPVPMGGSVHQDRGWYMAHWPP